ncbi:trigger factor [Azospirillum lipoferum]|uniref:Trigger factor n=1 Tax=Azospirillum lipoferum TaxID=193 RepID=A0A5A9GY91_AZOLI|nr:MULTISPECIES: trigger factor [Azospirillum]KAA0598469.1 trigger factor [Azospirillum lipoferum]MCP1609534.1 trigger factor [Azospirillum lipoferum]MDW5535157.1 trigger factor [Azospirillum sp. NL1]
MNITETSTDGLKREFQVVISAKDIEEKVNGKLEELRRTVQLPGFRPGKVPVTVIKQRYFGGVLSEVLEDAISDSSRQALSERGLRVALQPKIEVEKYEDGGDLTYKMAVELLPDVEPGDFTGIELEKPVAEVTEESVQEALTRLASSHATQAPVTEDRAAETGDIAVIDFAGTVDGEALEGMDGKDYPLELGAGRFVPGFEEQLVGVKAGEHRTVNVTFPEDYPHERLKGAATVFEVDVKELRKNVPAEVNDELAKEFGMESLEKMREAIRDRIKGEYDGLSRLRVKRQLLDKLAEAHSFEVPAGMVDIEFGGIWERLQEEIKNGTAGEDANKSEDELKAEYRSIAERRVRLGLLLSEVGRRNNIQVTQDEVNRALINEARRFPGQERQVFEFFKQNQQALENLRAPIFEDKVVDHILDQAKVTEKTVSVEELTKDEDEAGNESAAA